MSVVPNVDLIVTDFGEFEAPKDLPQMVKVTRSYPHCGCGCEHCCGSQTYEAHEPVADQARDFYAYVRAQGYRLRDELKPHTFTEWKAERLRVHARQHMQGAP